MKKRGQAALFIILGIIVVAIIIFLLIYTSRAPKEVGQISSLSFETQSVKNHVEFCIAKTAREAIAYIGNYGGYFQLPSHSTVEFNTPIVYHLYNNQNLIPSLNRIEHELAAYMDSELFFCLENFKDIKKSGIEIQQGESLTEVLIEQNKLEFNINVPIRTKKGDIEISISSFSVTIGDIRFETLYNIGKQIVNQQLSDPNSLCISCLTELVTENDLQLEISQLDNSTKLFTIKDKNSLINNQPYQYTFAIK